MIFLLFFIQNNASNIDDFISGNFLKRFVVSLFSRANIPNNTFFLLVIYFNKFDKLDYSIKSFLLFNLTSESIGQFEFKINSHISYLLKTKGKSKWRIWIPFPTFFIKFFTTLFPHYSFLASSGISLSEIKSFKLISNFNIDFFEIVLLTESISS